MKSFALKKQINNKGFYAELFFEIKHTNTSSHELHFNYLDTDKRWESTCRVGTLLFEEYFFRKNSGKIEIAIHKVKWMSVDSSHQIILFATVQALADALEFQINGLKFDEVNECFIFPDRRHK